MGVPVEQRGGHLGAAKNSRPFVEVEICGDSHSVCS